VLRRIFARVSAISVWGTSLGPPIGVGVLWRAKKCGGTVRPHAFKIFHPGVFRVALRIIRRRSDASGARRGDDHRSPLLLLSAPTLRQFLERLRLGLSIDGLGWRQEVAAPQFPDDACGHADCQKDGQPN
jgi:hypothetical protein